MSEPRPLVLLAAADVTAATLYQALLEMHGFEVAIVTNGFDAVEFALRERPAIAIVDAAVPQLGAVALCRLLKARRATEAMPLLLVTAEPDRTTRRDLLEAGADQLLVEPCAPELLALEAKRLAARAAAPRRPAEALPARRASDLKPMPAR